MLDQSNTNFVAVKKLFGEASSSPERSKVVFLERRREAAASHAVVREHSVSVEHPSALTGPSSSFLQVRSSRRRRANPLMNQVVTWLETQLSELRAQQRLEMTATERCRADMHDQIHGAMKARDKLML